MTVEPKAKRTVRGRTRAHRGRSALALVACAAVALACASEGDDAPGATSHDAAGRPPDTGASFVDQGTTEASSTEASTGPTSDSSSQAEASVNDGGVEAEAGQPPAFDRDAVRAIVTKVAEYQLSLYKTTASNDWIDATFYAGLMAAYKTTLKPSLLDAAKRWSASHQWALYSSDTRFADNQTCTQTYLEIYELDAAPANAFMYQTAQAAFDAMIAAPKGGRVDWWWCDALFMAPPPLARLGKSLKQPKYFDFLNTMYWDSKAYLFAPNYGLFWRDKKYFNKDTFWSRGNGWVIAGLARVLDYLPEDDARRADYVALLKTMAAALVPLQDSKDGLWRSNLLHPEPTPETSGSGFFTYAMAWGIHNGVLERDVYLPIVRKGWQGLVANVNAAGRLGYTQQVGESPVPAGPDETHPYGVGAFLLAGSQVVKL